MRTTKEKLRSDLRIVWAIGSKDIVDALKNKTILANIITVFLLMLFYKWVPNLDEPGYTRLVIYDAGRSRLRAALENSPRFELYAANSLQELEEKMSEGDNGALGLVIPAGSETELGAYVLWDRRASASDLKADFQQKLSALLEQPVKINVLGYVHHSPDAMGSVRLVSITLVMVTYFISLLTVPHLMFEEKQNQILDALLVSPASVSQVLAGKALAGAFYCLTTVSVTLAFNWAAVSNWGLMLLALSCGALFSIALGLALGTFLDTLQQMRSWGFVPMALLMIPAFLTLVEPILPPAVKNSLPWIPTSALADVLRYACSRGATWVQVWSRLGVVLGSALLILVLVAYQVRRLSLDF